MSVLLQDIANLIDQASRKPMNLDTFQTAVDGIRMDLANLPSDPAQRKTKLDQIGNQIQTLKTQNVHIKRYFNSLRVALPALLGKVELLTPQLSEVDLALQRAEAKHTARTTSCGRKALNTVGSFLYGAGSFAMYLGSRIVSCCTHSHKS